MKMKARRVITLLLMLPLPLILITGENCFAKRGAARKATTAKVQAGKKTEQQTAQTDLTDLSMKLGSAKIELKKRFNLWNGQGKTLDWQRIYPMLSSRLIERAEEGPEQSRKATRLAAEFDEQVYRACLSAASSGTSQDQAVFDQLVQWMQRVRPIEASEEESLESETFFTLLLINAIYHHYTHDSLFGDEETGEIDNDDMHSNYWFKAAIEKAMSILRAHNDKIPAVATALLELKDVIKLGVAYTQTIINNFSLLSVTLGKRSGFRCQYGY